MSDAGTPLGQRYLLHEVIGRGAMGQVYRATARDTGETFAAKVLRPELSSDEEVVARFVQERRILMRISSPNVVAVRDLVVEAQTLAIVADLVAGPSLRRYLEEAGTLAPAEAVALTIQVLHGLQAAHDLGVVHRDVKPENVLLDKGGTVPQARLTDFGVARLAHGQALTRMTSLIGTVAYLAPELSEGTRATPAADVWSTGVMLFELLSGVTPFLAGNLLAMIRAAAEREPIRLAGIPDDLWAAIAGMLAKAPEARPTASEAAATLEAMTPRLAGLAAQPRVQAPAASEALTLTPPAPPISAKPPPAEAEAGTRPGGRRRLVAILAAAGIVLAAAVAIAVATLNRAPAPVFQSFPPVLLGGNVSSQRTWRLAGDQLSAEVHLRNGGQSPANVTYDEVLPESVAPLAADLRKVAPAGYQVIKPDPVLRWAFPQVAPGADQMLTYQATSKGQGSPRERLAHLMADQQRAEALYDAQASIAIRVLKALAISPGTLNMAVGQTQLLTVTATLDDGSLAPPGAFRLTFDSAAPAVATVDTTGTVTATGPGTTTLNVAVGGISAQVPVTVAAPATSSPSLPVPRPSRTPSPTPTHPPSPSPSATPTPSPPPPSPPPPSSTPVPTEAEDYGTGPSPAVLNGTVQILFWKGADQNLWAGVFNSAWGTAPVSLGMGPLASQPYAAVDAAGRYYVFWKGTDGKLKEGFFDGAQWQGPVSLPQFGTLNSQPCVTVAPNGHQYVFWKGPDGNLIEASYNGSTWTGPVNLGMGPLYSAPTAGLDTNEHPYLYWRGQDGSLIEAFSDGQKWYGPLMVPAVTNVASAPSAIVLKVGVQSIYWMGKDKALWAVTWTGSAWSAPASIGMGPLNSRPLAGTDDNGHYWVYWRGTDSNIWGAAYSSPTWLGPASVPQMGTIGY